MRRRHCSSDLWSREESVCLQRLSLKRYAVSHKVAEACLAFLLGELGRRDASQVHRSEYGIHAPGE